MRILNGAGSSTEVIRHADLTAFIILKAISFDQRGGENKDAGDLVHVLRCAGTSGKIADEIMERYESGRHTAAILDPSNVSKRGSAMVTASKGICETVRWPPPGSSWDKIRTTTRSACWHSAA